MKRTRVALSPAFKPAVQDQHDDDGRIADNKVLSAVDKGHRYGNFHNYYNFNPTQERMKLLEDGILDYVARNWKNQSSGTEITANIKGNSEPDEKRIKTGEEGTSSQSNLDVSVLEKSESDYLTTFNYLDIGCNEGDLTMDVARALSKRLANDHHIQDGSSDKSEKQSQYLLQINVTGVDLDRILIKRAKGNYERKNGRPPEMVRQLQTQNQHQTCC